MMRTALFVAALLALAHATVYFEENFADGEAYAKRWISSTSKGDEAGKVGLSHGDHFGDENADVGLKTLEDARFYQVSAGFPGFSNKGKTLVLQFSVKHEQNIDCGGGYVKLLPAGLDQSSFNGDSEYNIMFGPDICGSTKRTHAILNYKGKNHLINGNVETRSDELSHLYTFVINPDQTYQILIDNKEIKAGNLADDWDFLLPKEIKDPSVSKPEDWVDERYIDDPSDVKPEGYDDIAETIADPDAEKPEDWDDELDGEWEAPIIDNPEYKGPWRAKRIDNPEYKGEWVHPLIANPDYVFDDNIYSFDSHAFVGLEIWQVKAGTIFDNFLVTDSASEASSRAEAILVRFAQEKENKEAADEAARKAAEEEAANAAEEEADEDDDDHDHDDEEAKDEL